jgi:hypothetical protein
VILPCGCDPEEGPSRGTRCANARTLIDRRKDAGGCSTPEGWRLLGELLAHFDEERERADALRVRALTRRHL